VRRGGEAGRGVVCVDGDADEQERDEGDDDETPGPDHLDPPHARRTFSSVLQRAARLSPARLAADMGRTPAPPRPFRTGTPDRPVSPAAEGPKPAENGRSERFRSRPASLAVTRSGEGSRHAL